MAASTWAWSAAICAADAGPLPCDPVEEPLDELFDPFEAEPLPLREELDEELDAADELLAACCTSADALFNDVVSAASADSNACSSVEVWLSVSSACCSRLAQLAASAADGPDDPDAAAEDAVDEELGEVLGAAEEDSALDPVVAVAVAPNDWITGPQALSSWRTAAFASSISASTVDCALRTAACPLFRLASRLASMPLDAGGSSVADEPLPLLLLPLPPTVDVWLV